MKPYGCFNRVRSAGYWTMQREYKRDIGLGLPLQFKMVPVYIKDALTQGCGYDKWATDERCKGCDHAGKGRLVSESKGAPSGETGQVVSWAGRKT